MTEKELYERLWNAERKSGDPYFGDMPLDNPIDELGRANNEEYYRRKAEATAFSAEVEKNPNLLPPEARLIRALEKNYSGKSLDEFFSKFEL